MADELNKPRPKQPHDGTRGACRQSVSYDTHTQAQSQAQACASREEPSQCVCACVRMATGNGGMNTNKHAHRFKLTDATIKRVLACQQVSDSMPAEHTCMNDTPAAHHRSPPRPTRGTTSQHWCRMNTCCMHTTSQAMTRHDTTRHDAPTLITSGIMQAENIDASTPETK